LSSGIDRYTSCALVSAEPLQMVKITIIKPLIAFISLKLKLFHLYGGVFLLIFKNHGICKTFFGYLNSLYRLRVAVFVIFNINFVFSVFQEELNLIILVYISGMYSAVLTFRLHHDTCYISFQNI